MNPDAKTPLLIAFVIVLVFIAGFSLGRFTATQDVEPKAALLDVKEDAERSHPSLEDKPATVVTSVDNSPSEVTSLEAHRAPLYKVVRVIDGDTIWVTREGDPRIIKVRFIGIDTPETVDPRKPVQCFGQEASNKAREMMEGTRVTLLGDPTQNDIDKYGRLLRYVYLEDGTFVNKELIRQGYAFEYTYRSNPYQYMYEFKAAELEAREGSVGLWDPDTCAGER